MKQDRDTVKSNSSFAFMLNYLAWNHMNVIFLQNSEFSQAKRMDNCIFFKNNFIKYYQYIGWHGKLFLHVKLLYAVKIVNAP